MSREDHDRIGTADLVAGAEQKQRPVAPEMAQRAGELPPQQQQPRMMDAPAGDQHPAMAGQAPQEQLAALFPPPVATEFRNRWDQVQIGFVDDPRQAVQQADELVAQVMKSLATSFAEQRARLEAGLNQGEQGNTENLRMALRGYRSFFQRLLSL